MLSDMSQKNEDFETPEFEQIREIMKGHVAGMEATNDEAVWIAAGMHHLLLTTVGRKSGTERKAALPYWVDPHGHRIVVGSYAGAPHHPAWYLNLADRTANPEVRVRYRDEEYWADAEILDGEDYAETWKGLTADRAFYLDYQAKTERRLPLIRLVRKRDA